MDKAELRRKIAEAQGATFEHVSEGNYAVHWRGSVGYGCSYGHAMYQVCVPHWPNDRDAALDLMVDSCTLVRIGADEDGPGEWECSSDDPRVEWPEEDSITKYADTPETAICLWRIAYDAALAEKRDKDEAQS